LCQSILSADDHAEQSSSSLSDVAFISHNQRVRRPHI
jgi:hypothetical protein